MGDDSRKTSYVEELLQAKAQHNNLNGSDVLQPSRVRRLIQGSHGLDKFLLDYGFIILPRFSFIIYLILLFA